MPFRSRSTAPLVALLTVGVLLVVPVGAAVADIINTGRFVIAEDAVQDEDVYVAATSGRVDGRIEGDLVIATESLIISGVVTGDVLVAARGTVQIDGTIEGSLRGVARRVEVRGAVGDDIAISAVTTELFGEIGRDVIGLGVSADIGGSVGRDVRGRFRTVDVTGVVARDVDVTVDRISIGAAAVVSGDVVYQSTREVEVASGAEIAGQTIQIPTDVPFFVGLVLSVVGLLGFLGYLFGGIVLLWLLRSTASRAVAAITVRPGQALGVGFGAVVLGPVLVVLLAASLVGIPLAVIALGVIAMGLFFGSVPLVAAVGARLLGGRGGVYAGFLLVAIIGRLLAFLWMPLGVALYLVGLVWGIGGWVLGTWRSRRAAPMPAG